jgi:hypothetical protein
MYYVKQVRQDPYGKPFAYVIKKTNNYGIAYAYMIRLREAGYKAHIVRG